MSIEDFPVVVIFATTTLAGEIAFAFDRERETVWATQAQIVELFGLDVSGVSRHIRNIFRDSEIDQESNLQKMQIANSDRPVTLYSLDVILAVGYRANSGRAIEFRRWATGVLKEYMIAGAAVNDRRLEEIGLIVRILSRSTDELVAGVADVLVEYLPGLQLLRDYDQGQLDATPGAAPSWTLTTDEARRVIAQVGAAFPNDTLFGNERGDAHDCHERPERKGPHGRACGSDAGRGGVVILRDMGLRNTNLRHTTALT